MASSSATLSLCSAFTSHCNVASRRSSPTLALLSKPSLSLSKPSTGFPSTASTSRPTFLAAPKFAESAVEAEPETTDVEAVVLSEVADEDKPKREEIFAVIMVKLLNQTQKQFSIWIYLFDFGLGLTNVLVSSYEQEQYSFPKWCYIADSFGWFWFRFRANECLSDLLWIRTIWLSKVML